MLVIRQKNPSLLIALGLSFALYVLGFTAFLFVLPLLLFYAKSGQRNQTLISFSSLLAFVLAYELVPLHESLGDPLSIGLLSVGLFLPIVLIGCSVIWVLLDSYRLLIRYIASCSFIGFFVIILGLWFNSKPEMVNALDATVIKIVESFLGSSQVTSVETTLSLGIPTEEVYQLVKSALSCMLVPFGAGVFGFNAFFSIANPKFPGDTEFDERVISWKLPDEMVWAFLASWLIILLGVVVDYNKLITIITLNIAIFLSLLYAIQGLAIILNYLKAKGSKMGAVRLFTIAAVIAILLQGLNIVIVIGLPILGVTETWFTYRK